MKIKRNEICANAVTARRYLITSVALAAAAAIYELFSHGVYSYHMIYAFMIPLVLGCMTHLADNRGIFEAGGQLGEILLASSVATLSIGSIIKGVLEIYGTTNMLTTFYPVAGVLLLAGAAAVCIINYSLKKAAGR